ncbi:alpha-D-ribose 1-methylphosphonate 5-triphosphate diphosphatase [Xanthobacter tagetidis]|uniref:Alpha-D-ribose 1-methylphosphonate 5-triphosphate diphosphatase n=1 Tax=Xanthobacter tagetidis TaxID=60216 RepID=A0A3L7AIS2_9HYPH|nr:alpha-D-ribose 1-methylphosphonate 5-triphosphate diphosphatase [Xanthobacter tagetidis]MBB6306796.1 alpha-D-ribose 1-methylphosphonate 5-triphosphate diphosphatase [Xanthobacter tagetidis]RLP80127.1 alpha-D-ribose 1-methylphosphonate 5-triphosphate diphosphatase [Xanthobacter tagetidis]
MTEQVLANARLVLADEMVLGHVHVRGGRIAAVGTGAVPQGAQDLDGDFVVPGLVELHTDHVEGHLSPRPKVRWNPMAAAMAHDAQIAASGITTVFDSLRIWPDKGVSSLDGDLPRLVAALAEARAAGVLRADHFLHLRCEVPTKTVVEDAAAVMTIAPVSLISLMDHTPGQRQFASVEQFASYYMEKAGIGPQEMDAIIASRIAFQECYARANRQELVALAHAHGCVLASHDDATAEHVAQAVAEGAALAEFPTTYEAAKLSHAAGVRVLMGAPNLVRGGSHTGNVAAEDLAREGMLDILSSDYVPSSLLWAAFELPRRVPSITLPEAVRMVSRTPARAAGLDDRGEIAAGQRADLVRVRLVGDMPVVREVHRAGIRVA